MNRRTFLTISVTAAFVALFAVGALFDLVAAPAIGGVALAFVAMVLTQIMTSDHDAPPPSTFHELDRLRREHDNVAP